MDSWPLTLPQAPHESFDITPLSGLLSDADTLSPQRIRTYPDAEATFTMRLTIAQVHQLRNFYNVTLNQCKPFSAPWLAEAGFTHHFCQFVDPPSIAMRGLKFDASLKLRIISGVPEALGAIVYGSVL